MRGGGVMCMSTVESIEYPIKRKPKKTARRVLQSFSVSRRLANNRYKCSQKVDATNVPVEPYDPFEKIPQ